MDRREHWEGVYTSKATDRLGWFRPHLETSFSWIGELGLSPDSPLIDIGGGASTLVDDLIEAGHTAITVLDVSEAALDAAKSRLGEQARLVTWIRADVTDAGAITGRFELWHDRAVFHFLVEEDDRRAYVANLEKSVEPGGHLVIGTFAPEAPPKCSGLPVQRYEHEQLAEALGSGFELLRHHKEMHVTPGGVEQMYVYCLFRRIPEQA